MDDPCGGSLLFSRPALPLPAAATACPGVFDPAIQLQVRSVFRGCTGKLSMRPPPEKVRRLRDHLALRAGRTDQALLPQSLLQAILQDAARNACRLRLDDAISILGTNPAWISKARRPAILAGIARHCLTGCFGHLRCCSC